MPLYNKSHNFYMFYKSVIISQLPCKTGYVYRNCCGGFMSGAVVKEFK